MPTSKRRLILSLSPELDRAIDRFAKAQGRPRAAVIRDVLEEIAPQLESLAQVIEDSKARPEQAFRTLYATLLGAIAHGASLGSDMLTDKGDKRD